MPPPALARNIGSINKQLVDALNCDCKIKNMIGNVKSWNKCIWGDDNLAHNFCGQATFTGNYDDQFNRVIKFIQRCKRYMDCKP